MPRPPFLAFAATLALLGSPAGACIGGPRFVTFEHGSAELDAAARSMLDDEVEWSRSWGEFSPRRILGHADRVGSPEANLGLSRRRAEAVRDYLAARGLPYGSMTIVAFGESDLMVETADGVSEPLNRYVRVEEVPTLAELERRAADRRARGDTTVC